MTVKVSNQMILNSYFMQAQSLYIYYQ